MFWRRLSPSPGDCTVIGREKGRGEKANDRGSVHKICDQYIVSVVRRMSLIVGIQYSTYSSDTYYDLIMTYNL